MALIRWQPFQEMNALQRDMNRLFDTLAPMNQESMMKSAFAPPAEMEETEDALHLKLELPGMNPNELDVQVTKEAITIRGERKSESKSEENGMTRSEFRYGQFSRTIPLPTRIDNTNVQAEYKDGILTLNLPKAEEDKSKVVKVNVVGAK
jgi:HSP20 family protein